MSTPERALEEARAALAEMQARGAYTGAETTNAPSSGAPSPAAKLIEWALAEPDLNNVRSTRRLGAPITWIKRGLLKLLGQYHAELIANQARVNAGLVLHIQALEERLDALEKQARER